MAPPSEYGAVPTSGRLKLKGVKDSKVDKKVKKKKTKAETEGDTDFKDNSVVLKSLEDEDAAMTKEKRREVSLVDGKQVAPGAGVADEELGERIKTDAERRYDEQRRRRVRGSSVVSHDGMLTVACSWTNASSVKA